jgi:hypothetical protein
MDIKDFKVPRFRGTQLRVIKGSRKIIEDKEVLVALRNCADSLGLGDLTEEINEEIKSVKKEQ